MFSGLDRKKSDVTASSLAMPNFKEVLSNLRSEFDEHLEAINDNTNEIQANYEYLLKLDEKIEKISERIDQMQLFLQRNFNCDLGKKQVFKVQPLNDKEKEVFMVLYTIEELRGNCTLKDISRRTGYTENLVSSYIINLVEKGVPILKKYQNGRSIFSVNKSFRHLQATENILKIEQQTLIKSFDN